MKRGEGWPDERVLLLRRLLLQGLTDPEIADRMGLTKGAVSGKRYRLGLAANWVRRHAALDGDIGRILRE